MDDFTDDSSLPDVEDRLLLSPSQSLTNDIAPDDDAGEATIEHRYVDDTVVAGPGLSQEEGDLNPNGLWSGTGLKVDLGGFSSFHFSDTGLDWFQTEPMIVNVATPHHTNQNARHHPSSVLSLVPILPVHRHAPETSLTCGVLHTKTRSSLCTLSEHPLMP